MVELVMRNFWWPIKGCAEQEQSDLEWSGITPEWKGVDNKSRGTTLASTHVLCLDLLSHVWLRIRRTELLSGALERSGID